jgi:glutathione peroxidase
MISQTSVSPTLASFTVTTLAGKSVPLSDYAGKVVLIVNTASACGFTPQYQGLQALYAQYEAQGLVVLAFPCNQFGAQEKSSSAHIGEFCEAKFAVRFPIMAKIEVNGVNASPLYVWLTNSKRGVLGTRYIKWNFTKFLISKDGTVFERYGSMTKPQALARDIERLLAA